MQQEMMRLIRKKYKCLCVLLAILFICYFMVPLIIAVTTVEMLPKMTIGGIPFLWLYTFLQIPLTWLLSWVYVRYAKKMDTQAEVILQKGELP